MSEIANVDAPTFEGIVTTGHKRGRILGFPTANIALTQDSGIPGDGVYSCWVQFPPNGAWRGATASIGFNPTFDDVKQRQIEVYVHDLNADIYGAHIAVTIVEKLRDMTRFDSVDDLISQTAQDVKNSRALLAGVKKKDRESHSSNSIIHT